MSFKTTVYGKYFLLDRVAVGGMAEVFKAKTFGVRGFERLLVIKRILPHLSKDEEFVEMFIDEAKIAVELNHANICQVTDLGKIFDNYFIAMEYIDGKDLRAILKKCFSTGQQLPVPFALYIAMETLKGLDYAHRKVDTVSGKPLNLIHRDISPQNVMVSYHGDVKIVDFGIAKTEFKLNRTQEGVLKGKFGYMSPEQASGLELDSRTDLFSAGIILYEMLTGRRLFLGENDLETLEKIKECSVPPPSKYNPMVSPEVEHVVLKLLAKEKEDRFESAEAANSMLSKVFYTKHSDFSVRDLAGFLTTLFAEDIERDQESLRRALDSLPKEELDAVKGGLEADADRIVESGPHRLPGHTSPPKLVKTIGADIGSSGDQGSGKGMLGSLVSWLLILAVAGGLGLFAWKWLSPKPIVKIKVVATPTPAMQLVDVATDPAGAALFVNGEPRGSTPATIDVPLNRLVQLKFQKDGFKPFEKDVRVGAEITSLGPYALEKATVPMSTLLVTTAPAGASIWVDDEDTGKITPATLSLSLHREIALRVKKPGYVEQGDEHKVEEINDEHHFKLEPTVLSLKLNVSGDKVKVFNRAERGIEMYSLEAGKSYDLEVRADGYETLKTKYRFQGPRDEVSFELRKVEIPTGTISISGQPWANIFVDDKMVVEGDVAVIDYRVKAGEHIVRFERPDMKAPIEKKVTVKAGRKYSLVVDVLTGEVLTFKEN